MPEAKPSSFLAGVKSQLTQLFADAYDQIAADFGDSVPEVVPEEMQRLQKRTWEVVEKGLKTSYLNGRNAGPREHQSREPSDVAEIPKPTANPFRKT